MKVVGVSGRKFMNFLNPFMSIKNSTAPTCFSSNKGVWSRLSLVFSISKGSAYCYHFSDELKKAGKACGNRCSLGWFRLGSTWFDYAHQPTLTNRRSPTDAQPPPQSKLNQGGAAYELLFTNRHLF